jgi:hypothetical protein
MISLVPSTSRQQFNTSFASPSQQLLTTASDSSFRSSQSTTISPPYALNVNRGGTSTPNSIGAYEASTDHPTTPTVSPNDPGLNHNHGSNSPEPATRGNFFSNIGRAITTGNILGGLFGTGQRRIMLNDSREQQSESESDNGSESEQESESRGAEAESASGEAH